MAVHAVALGHDTAVKPPAKPLSSTGVCIVQLVPFQRSASGATNGFGYSASSEYSPTSVHASAVLQETPKAGVNTPPGPLGIGFGVFVATHRFPFHRSANSHSSGEAPLSKAKPPTAMQTLDERHETAVNSNAYPLT
jgi:hypothetical protein